MVRECLYCKTKFIINSSQQKFCCVQHKKEYRNIIKKQKRKEKLKKPREYKKVCIKCGKEFIAKTINRLECDYCRGRKNCEYCGKEFQSKDRYRKTCSVECDKKLRNLKTRQTSLKRYGTEYPNQTKEVKDKIRKSQIEHLGNHPSRIPEIMERRKQRNLKKYGVEQTLQVKKIRDQIVKTRKERYGEHMEEITKKSIETCMEKYGFKYGVLSPKCKCISISKENIRISNLLKEQGLENELEFKIENYSYDIHILNTNILIEVDPTYTHNSTNSYKIGDKVKPPKSSRYHYNKSIKARKHNYICIHKYDWQTDEDLIEFIKESNNFSYGIPRLHWYNQNTKEHFLDNSFDKDKMISNGFVEVFDDGLKLLN